jgi:glycine cleavage system H protein
MEIPDRLKYTDEHEWVEVIEGALVRVGITDYAQDALGDVVFVQLPEPGAHLDENALLAEVESTKSVAEVYAPVAGTVRAVNQTLRDRPEVINTSPYGEGWFVELEVDDPAVLEGLLDAPGYRALTEG